MTAGDQVDQALGTDADPAKLVGLVLEGVRLDIEGEVGAVLVEIYCPFNFICGKQDVWSTPNPPSCRRAPRLGPQS